MGLTEKAYFMAGITPLKSLGMAKYMKNSVPGIRVPDELIERMKGVPKDKQVDEGIKIACEQIQEIKSLPGSAGVHMMLIEWEHMVPRMVQEAKIGPSQRK
jgi:methylenetetrahydrofolate reductase (NADPH)